MTTYALALSNYLSGKCGEKTAYVELNPTGQIASLAKDNSKRKTFMHCGILMVPDATYSETEDICAGKQSRYILDYGILAANNLQHFMRADVCIVIGSICPWNLSTFGSLTSKIVSLSEKYQKGAGNFFFMAPSGKRYLFHRFKKEYGVSLIPIPVLDQPFSLSARDWLLLERVVSGFFIPQN